MADWLYRFSFSQSAYKRHGLEWAGMDRLCAVSVYSHFQKAACRRIVFIDVSVCVVVCVCICVYLYIRWDTGRWGGTDRGMRSEEREDREGEGLQ